MEKVWMENGNDMFSLKLNHKYIIRELERFSKDTYVSTFCLSDVVYYYRDAGKFKKEIDRLKKLADENELEMRYDFERDELEFILDIPLQFINIECDKDKIKETLNLLAEIAENNKKLREGK